MLNEINKPAADAIAEYFEMPVNFGDDSYDRRLAEADAFVAGWDACINYILSVVEESDISPLYKMTAGRIAPNFKATREV